MRIEFRIKVACACFIMAAVWMAIAFTLLAESTAIANTFSVAYAADPNIANQEFAHARQQLKYTTTIALAIAAGLSGLITVWIMQTYERTLTRPILAVQRLAEGDTGFRYRRADLDPSLRSSHDPIAKLLYEVSRVSTVIEERSAATSGNITQEKKPRRRDLFKGQSPTKHPARQKPHSVTRTK